MPASSAFFGTELNIDTLAYAFSTETLELMDGLSTAQHTDTVQLEISAEGTLCDAYGIAASDDTARNNTSLIITSARYSLQEIVSEPCLETHPDYIDSGDFSIPNFSKALRYFGQHLWLAIEESIEIEATYKGLSGLNTLGQTLLKQGSHVSTQLIIGPAASPSATAVSMGDYLSYTTPPWPYINIAATNDRTQQFLVSNVTKTQNEEWHTASISLTRRLGVTSGAHTATSKLDKLMYLLGSSPAGWKPSANWMGYTIGDITMYSINIEFSLTQEANAKLSEKVSVFPTTSDDQMLAFVS